MGVREIFVERLKEAIKEKGVTQFELANKAHISGAYISQILKGKKTPTIKVAMQIADALELPVSFFLENGVEINIYLRKNKSLSEEDIKAIDAFVDYLIQRKNEDKKTT